MRLVLRSRQQDVEQWPDGRPIMDQPIRLIDAFGVVNEYLEQNSES